MKEFIKENPPRFVFLGGLALIVLLLLVGLGTFLFKKQDQANVDPNLLATVAGENIYKADLNKFLFGITMGGSPEAPDLKEYQSVPTSQFLDMYIENKILQKESQALGIEVTDEEVSAQMAEKFPWMEENNSLKEYVGDYQRYLILKEKASTKVLGSKSGHWVMARNDMYTPDVGTEPTEAQKTKIEQNKVYSKKFIDGIYKKLQDGTITIEQAVELEQKDPFIGKGVVSTNVGLHSAAFDEEMFRDRQGLLSHPEVLEKVMSMKEGDFSEPIHFITQDGLDNGWYILHLSKSASDSLGKTYEEWLADQYAKNQVKIYLEENNE